MITTIMTIPMIIMLMIIAIVIVMKMIHDNDE